MADRSIVSALVHPAGLSPAQEDGDLPAQLDATGLAAVLVAATDGLKDLSDILDPPNRSRRGVVAGVPLLCRDRHRPYF